MKKSLVATAVVAVLLPLSVACGSSGDIATTDQTTTTTDATTTSASPSQSTTTPPSTPPTVTTPTPTAPTPTHDGNRLAGTGFSIAIPPDWEDITASLKANNPQLDIAIGEKNATTFRTNFNVVQGNATTATIEHDSEAIRREAAAELKTVTHAVVTPLPDRTIDGNPAIGQTSSFKATGTSVTFLQYVAIHNGKAYPVTMTYASANAAKAKPLLDTILGSWQWTS